MEKEEMKITPQDIIDREFRVKFRGFDMAEVDTFLEEVAESFFKLTEENILLNEKVLALKQDLETRGSMAPQGPVELPAELGNFLEELKQDTAAIGAELAALKQDRQILDSLKENLEKVVASIQESGAAKSSQSQVELPTDLSNTLEDLKKNSESIAAELATLKEERQAFESLKKTLEETIGSANETASPVAPQQGLPGSGELGKTLEALKQGTETLGTELTALKEEVGSF
jgi:cell division initiation protein